MMAVDLLYGDASVARRVKEESQSLLTREEYLRQQKELFDLEVYDGVAEDSAKTRRRDAS